MLLLLLLLLLTITHFTEVTLGPGALSTCPLAYTPKSNVWSGPKESFKGASTKGTLPKGHFGAHPVTASPAGRGARME